MSAAIMKDLYMKLKNDGIQNYLKKKKRKFMFQVVLRLVETYMTEYPREFWDLLLMAYSQKTSTIGTHNLSTREKWLEETLLKIPGGYSILDAGAGELQYKKFCSHLVYTSQDFAQYDGQGDASGLQIGSWDNSKLDIISDITSIPRPNASFDSVMCIEVLEHVPHPVAAIKEMVRILKPGGWLVITAPFASLTHFSPYHFTSGFSHYFYEYWAMELGLEILDLQANGNYFDYIAQELNRLPDIASKYADMEIDKEQVIIKALLGKLGELSKADRGSTELLTYGFHFFARKHGNGENKHSAK